MNLLKKNAAATGGDAFFSGMKMALPEVLNNGSDYYTLSYVPTNANWNGAYRKISLDVSGIPEAKSSMSWYDRFLGWDDEETKVQYRRGYFARAEPASGRDAAVTATEPPAHSTPGRKLISYSPRGDTNLKLTPMRAAMRFGALTPSEFPIKVTVTPSAEVTRPWPGPPPRQDDAVARPFQALPYRSCRVRYWVDPASLHFKKSLTADSFHASLEFAAAVYRDDGAPVTSIQSNEQIQISAGGLARALNSGITYDQTIAVPLDGNPNPGNFFIRVGVAERPSGHVGTIEIPTEWIKLPSPSNPHSNIAATH
jgi:hypothetical protein